MPKIVAHHLEKSRSHRVLWALEALELPYEVKRYPRNPETMRGDPALKAVHPLGKSPVITIDGVVYAESGAILDKLSDLTGGKLRPTKDSDEFRLYSYFLHYAEGSLMPPLLIALITGKLRSAPVPFFLKPIVAGIGKKIDSDFTNKEVQAQLNFLEQELSSRDFLTGDTFTLADIQNSYPIGAVISQREAGEFPKLEAYFQNLQARPDYQRALTAGGDTGSLIPG